MSDDLDLLAASPEHFSLTDKHVVVTGGGRGLGQGIAVSAALSGAAVTVVARSKDQLHATADLIARTGGTCRVVTADLSDTESLDRLVDDLSESAPIDGIVHVAGVQLRKAAVDVTVDDWRWVQRMNVEAPFFLSTAVARRQQGEGRPGSHVFIGSLNSTIGLPRISPYAASKTALLGMARVLSTEWAAHGQRANVVGPGYFHTQLTDDLFTDPANRARILGRIPAGRLGTPADLGGAVVFLLSDASRYLTGQLINVDGGWLAS
ncbi:short-chain dehydrogenase/reductase SDR [Nocardioides sp. JS614]|nr:short-chain dehydrogenase/reductase SDR [Nocardioides sp. JS614]